MRKPRRRIQLLGSEQHDLDIGLLGFHQLKGFNPNGIGPARRAWPRVEGNTRRAGTLDRARVVDIGVNGEVKVIGLRVVPLAQYLSQPRPNGDAMIPHAIGVLGVDILRSLGVEERFEILHEVVAPTRIWQRVEFVCSPPVRRNGGVGVIHFAGPTVEVSARHHEVGIYIVAQRLVTVLFCPEWAGYTDGTHVRIPQGIPPCERAWYVRRNRETALTLTS